MCAVDAIQFLTGCTFGKGNLIHRDWGKNAYAFWRRSDGRALRIVGRRRPGSATPSIKRCSTRSSPERQLPTSGRASRRCTRPSRKGCSMPILTSSLTCKRSKPLLPAAPASAGPSSAHAVARARWRRASTVSTVATCASRASTLSLPVRNWSRPRCWPSAGNGAGPESDPRGDCGGPEVCLAPAIRPEYGAADVRASPEMPLPQM